MAIKKAATSDTTKINVAVIEEHLKGIDKALEDIHKEVKDVSGQFKVLNGSVQRHETSLAIINEQDLETRISQQESFKSRMLGGLAVLAGINVIFLILNYVHSTP